MRKFLAGNQAINISGRLCMLLFVDSLYIIAVRIENVRGVIAGIIFQASAWGAVVVSSCCDRGLVKSVHGSMVFPNKSEVDRR